MADFRPPEYMNSGKTPHEIEIQNSDMNGILRETKFFEDARHIRADIAIYKKVLAAGEKPVGFMLQMAEDAFKILSAMDKQENTTKFMKLASFYIDMIEKIEERLGHGDERSITVNVKKYEQAEVLKQALIQRISGTAINDE